MLTTPRTPGARRAIDRAGTVCELSHMATNLSLDDRLLQRALRIGGHRTKKATVTEALEEYIARRRRAKIVELFGTLDIDTPSEAKAQRRR